MGVSKLNRFREARYNYHDSSKAKEEFFKAANSLLKDGGVSLEVVIDSCRALAEEDNTWFPFWVKRNTKGSHEAIKAMWSLIQGLEGNGLDGLAYGLRDQIGGYGFFLEGMDVHLGTLVDCGIFNHRNFLYSSDHHYEVLGEGYIHFSSSFSLRRIWGFKKHNSEKSYYMNLYMEDPNMIFEDCGIVEDVESIEREDPYVVIHLRECSIRPARRSKILLSPLTRVSVTFSDHEEPIAGWDDY